MTSSDATTRLRRDVFNGGAHFRDGAAASPGLTDRYALQDLFERVKSRDPNQPEFLQAVEEVFTTMAPVLKKHPEFLPALERLVEPERQIIFRVRCSISVFSML